MLASERRDLFKRHARHFWRYFVSSIESHVDAAAKQAFPSRAKPRQVISNGTVYRALPDGTLERYDLAVMAFVPAPTVNVEDAAKVVELLAAPQEYDEPPVWRPITIDELRAAYVTDAIAARIATPAFAEMDAAQYRNTYADSVAQMTEKARSMYPSVNVTRPRVATDTTGKYGTYFWRVNPANGVLQYSRVDSSSVIWQDVVLRSENSPVQQPAGMFINATRLRLLADLLDNPTEPVTE